MKAAVVEKLNKLVLKEVPDPKIAQPTQVKVKAKIAGICTTTDPNIIEGKHSPQRPFPSILGHEGSGDVVEIGNEVTEFKVGDRVAVRGWENACMAEYIVSSPDNLIKIPDTMSYEEASVLELLHCVYSLAVSSIKPDDVVAVFGQGASGLLSNQVARAFGASKVIGIDRNQYKLDLAKKLGADTLVNLKDTNDIIKTIGESSDGGVDSVIDTIGAPDIFKIFPDLLKIGGKIGLFAVISQPVEYSFHKFVCKGAMIVSTTYGEGYTKRAFQKALELAVSGKVKLKPLVTHVFPLEQLHKAFKLLKERTEPRIKVALRM